VTNHVEGKSIIITGAASGFGRLAAERLAGLGAAVTCADVNAEGLAASVAQIRAGGGRAQAVAADVGRIEDMRALARQAVEAYGAIDVMINNAGVMPLAFLADHASALDAWDRCIDINFRGVMNGVTAVFDQMTAQGRGHVVNVSSIYGNRPVSGAAIYGATKAAVDYFSHALRQEGRGKIKVTLVKPTGVRATGLSTTIVNRQAAAGVVGHNIGEFMTATQQLAAGEAPPEWGDPEHIQYDVLAPEYVVDAIVFAVNQPWGVAISDVTVRAAGDYYVV
jgi:NADP-dependent 3-hydroxy acid dehydrogenase YdfG